VNSVRDVTSFLAGTISRVRKGSLDVRIANAVGYLAGVLLKALEVGKLEDRLARLEGPMSTTRMRALAASL
jgi:hypothetical protein